MIIWIPRAPAEPPAEAPAPRSLGNALRWPFGPLAWGLLRLGVVLMKLGETVLILSVMAKSVHDGIPRRLEVYDG